MQVAILTFSALKEKIFRLGKSFAIPAAQPQSYANSCHIRYFAG
jgi:hypothetical protein